MQKADKETIKKNNKKVLLNCLREQDLSRTDLAAATGLSNSTVSTLIAELTAENFVFEKRVAESSGGRKPIILSINPDVSYTMLIKIIPFKIIFALVDLKLRVIYQNELSFLECSETYVREAIIQGIGKTAADNRLDFNKILGVGVSVPGMVDHRTDELILSSLLNIKNMDIRSIIGEKIGKRIYIFKDTDALMLGEYILNHLNGKESYVYLLVDSGVGLSFMNRGEILQLNRGGFQIGHVQLDEHGPQCNCGNFGCVEAFISEQAARRDLKLASAHDADYHVDIENLKYSDIVSRSNRGDPYAKEVLFNQCEYLGRAVAMAINLYAPNMVLIGGPLSQSRIDIIDIIEKSAAKNELEIFRNGNTEIKFTNTGEKACFIGMANKIVNSEFFKREI